jgi:dTDP-4-amino-4,6-dideoxygalactose transaminase
MTGGRAPATIPICDPRPHAEPLQEELLAVAARVIGSGAAVLGEEVAAFEAAAAEYLGVPHAVGVNSGTDALTIALAALGVGPGDAVITTAFTFFGTAEAISRLGAKPRFVDIDPVSYNLNPDAVAAAVGRHTRCILPVHLFGAAADMDALVAVAADAEVPIVEDAAQAFGARWNGRCLGSIGALGAFSFYPTKNLAGFGDGGLIATHDAALAERCRQLRNHGNRGDGVHTAIGFNSRLDALQAALLRVKLPHVDGWNAERRRIAQRYHALLRDLEGVRLPQADDSERHVWHQYTIRVAAAQRDELVDRLRQAGIGAMVYYANPVHLQPPYHGHDVRLPEAEAAAAEVLSLPMWPGLSLRAQERVAAALAAALDQTKRNSARV